MKPSCSGCSVPPCSSPSTVMSCLPLACTANSVHDFTARPSSSTVQAPQCVVSHPMWVPVSRSTSRIRCTSSSRGSTSAACFSPLIVRLTCMALPPCRALDRPAQGAHGQHAHQVLLVLGRSSQVVGGLRGVRREPGGRGDRRLVGRLALQRGFGPRGLDRRETHVG